MKYLLGLALLLTSSWACAQSCTSTLSSGANVGSAISGASAGAVICLNNGNYSGWTSNGVAKNPRVLIRSVNTLGATITSQVNLQGSTRGLTFDGINFADVYIIGSSDTVQTTRDITIRNSKFDGSFLVVDTVYNANILFSNNQHINAVSGAGRQNARIHLQWGSDNPSGVTVEYSYLANGSADGIQSGAPMTIVGNEFYNISELPTCSINDCHTDAIQLVGTDGSIVRGNYIHSVVSGIVAFDTIKNALIENNVIDMGPQPINGQSSRDSCIELYADNSSTVQHNTCLFRASCDSTSCGHISLSHKTADPAGTGTILRNNIATSIVMTSQTGSAPLSTAAVNTNNLLRSGGTSPNLSGSPTYSGGTTPSTWQDYRLSAGSAGKNAATDGRDIGANSFNPPAPSNFRHP